MMSSDNPTGCCGAPTTCCSDSDPPTRVKATLSINKCPDVNGQVMELNYDNGKWIGFGPNLENEPLILELSCTPGGTTCNGFRLHAYDEDGCLDGVSAPKTTPACSCDPINMAFGPFPVSGCCQGDTTLLNVTITE